MDQNTPITEQQYRDALGIVNQYRKQQLEANFPRVVFDHLHEFNGFQIRDRRVQISPRKFENEAYVIFPELGYRLSNFATLYEVRLIGSNGQKADAEEVIHRPGTFLICWLIREIRYLSEVTKEGLEQIVDHYESSYKIKVKRAEVEETPTGFRVKVNYGIAFWNHNLELTKI